MKNVTRGALTAIAIATALGISACGTAAAPADQAAQGNASASATPSVDSNKAKGFSTSFTFNGDSLDTFPAEWRGGEGMETQKAFAIGKHVGYMSTPDEAEASDQTAPPTGSATAYNRPRQVFVIDEKGTVVYKSKELGEESSTLTGSDLDRISVNGKNYLVFTQDLKVKQDPSSTRTAEDATSVTVIDEQGKELSSQVINGQVSVGNGAVAVTGETGEVTKTLDVTTGKVNELAIPNGYSWYGSFDGENIYGLVEADGFSAEGMLTNGTWTAKVNADYDKTSTPESFGTLMRVQRYVGFGKPATAYDLMDPHTGKVVLGADLKDGVTFSATPDRSDSSSITSPNHKLVVTNEKGSGNGVFSITENKHYKIAADLNFRALSVTDDGYVYGQSTSAVAGYNILKEAEPKIIAGALRVPSEVSESGIGIFGFGKVVVLKPQS